MNKVPRNNRTSWGAADKTLERRYSDLQGLSSDLFGYIDSFYVIISDRINSETMIDLITTFGFLTT